MAVALSAGNFGSAIGESDFSALGTDAFELFLGSDYIFGVITSLAVAPNFNRFHFPLPAVACFRGEGVGDFVKYRVLDLGLIVQVNQSPRKAYDLVSVSATPEPSHALIILERPASQSVLVHQLTGEF